MLKWDTKRLLRRWALVQSYLYIQKSHYGCVHVQICSLYESYKCCIWVCECGCFMFNCKSTVNVVKLLFFLSSELIIAWVAAVWKPISCGVLHLENNFILLFPPVLHAMFWSLLPRKLRHIYFLFPLPSFHIPQYSLCCRFLISAVAYTVWSVGTRRSLLSSRFCLMENAIKSEPSKYDVDGLY